MFKFNSKENRTTSTVFLLLNLSLTLRNLVPLLLTLNIFYILHDVKYAKIRASSWKKGRRAISLTDWNWSVFRFSPEYKAFVRIYPECINRILRYINIYVKCLNSTNATTFYYWETCSKACLKYFVFSK